MKKEDLHRNRIAWIALGLSVVAAITSVIAISIAAYRSPNLGFDYQGVIVGILSLLVTILIGWQIYNALEIKKEIKKEIDNSLSQFEKRSLVAIINSQYAYILRDAYIAKTINDYNRYILDLANGLYFASLISDIEKTDFCISNAINALNNKGSKIEESSIKQLKESLYLCTGYSKKSIELLESIGRFLTFALHLMLHSQTLRLIYIKLF